MQVVKIPESISKDYFEPFYEHLFGAGLGTISEIFDGDCPHTPRGCISQAWSVAEILLVYFEHIYMGLRMSGVKTIRDIPCYVNIQKFQSRDTLHVSLRIGILHGNQ